MELLITKKNKIRMKEKTRNWIIIILACLGYIYLYSFSVDGKFIFDDLTYLVKNDIIKKTSPYDLYSIFFKVTNYWGEAYPVRDLLYVIQYGFFGDAPGGYHIVSIFLFLITSFVLLYWVFTLLKNNFIELNTTSNQLFLLSIFAMSLFLLHPIYVEVIAYISGQKDVLSTLFILLSLVCFYKIGTKPGKIIVLFFAGIIFHYLALFSKLSALSTVVFVPVMWVISSNLSPKLIIRYTVIFLILNIPILFWMQHFFEISDPYLMQTETLNFLERIPRAFNFIGMYLSHIIMPWPLNLGYPDYFKWKFDILFITGLFCVLLYILLLIKRRNTLETLGLTIFFIYLLPVLQIFDDMPNDKVYDRYLAVPFIGILITLISILFRIISKWDKSKFYITGLAVSVLVSLSFLSFMYIPSFNNMLSSTKHTYEYFPHWEKSAFNYANILINSYQFEEANTLISSENRFVKNKSERFYLQGRICMEQRKFDTAIDLFYKSYEESQRIGSLPWADGPLAYLLIMMNRKDEARTILKRMISDNPKDPILLYKAESMLKQIDQ